MHIMDIPEGEKKNGREEILKLKKAKNFTKLMTDTKPQIQEIH